MSRLSTSATGEEFTGDLADEARLQPRIDGEHIWVATAVYRLDDFDAAATAATGGQVRLAGDKLAMVLVGCYACEQPVSERLRHRRCRPVR